MTKLQLLECLLNRTKTTGLEFFIEENENRFSRKEIESEIEKLEDEIMNFKCSGAGRKKYMNIEINKLERNNEI